MSFHFIRTSSDLKNNCGWVRNCLGFMRYSHCVWLVENLIELMPIFNVKDLYATHSANGTQHYQPQPNWEKKLTWFTNLGTTITYLREMLFNLKNV